MADVQATLKQISDLQLANTQQLNKLTTDVTTMDQWVKNFAIESQRLFTRIGGTAEKNEVAVDSLHQSVVRLTNNAEADRIEARQDRSEIRSMVSRLDALVNHLMKGDED